MRRFRAPQTAFASGWMASRARRRRGYERGFVLSDHADWQGLIRTVLESGARTVYVTHGQSDVLARFLRNVMASMPNPWSSLPDLTSTTLLTDPWSMRSAGIVGLSALLISSPGAGLAQQVEITIEQIETVVFPAEGGAAAQAICAGLASGVLT